MICCLVAAGTDPPAGQLDAIARSCSPRVEVHGDRAVLFDAGGLGRVLGPPAEIAAEVTRLAAARGLSVRLALAGTAVTAWLLAQARAGITIVPPGDHRRVLAPLPLACLPAWTGDTDDPDRIEIFRTWGLLTLGDLARLPRADLAARMGAGGVRLHQAACGEDTRPLVPAAEAPRFIERLDLEWPVDGLEPLSFVLARLCDALSASLERADRGAVSLTTTARLVNRTTHIRVLQLPAPMRDARVLRTLILLDLESHPPPAAIDVVDVEAQVAPGRIVTGALFAQPLPAPEDLATLLARLGALMGETRVGAPVAPDTHDGRAAGLAVFRARPAARADAGGPGDDGRAATPGPLIVRRFRLPIAARVTLAHGRPAYVSPSARGLAGGPVIECAGPWRSSGEWWSLDRRAWDRDEWDAACGDGIYRLACDRATGQWVVEGIVD